MVETVREGERADCRLTVIDLAPGEQGGKVVPGSLWEIMERGPMRDTDAFLQDKTIDE